MILNPLKLAMATILSPYKLLDFDYRLGVSAIPSKQTEETLLTSNGLAGFHETGYWCGLLLIATS